MFWVEIEPVRGEDQLNYLVAVIDFSAALRRSARFAPIDLIL
jgi:hypothetical protein